MLKIQLCVTGINYASNYIQIEKELFLIVIKKTVFYCVFDQINAALLSIRESFQNHTHPKQSV